MSENERSSEKNSLDAAKPKEALVVPRISSVAGLSSYSGGQAKTLPSVPSPGQPGSRFNPVVISREEQAARRARAEQSGPDAAAPTSPGVAKGSKKSLDIGLPPGLINEVPKSTDAAAKSAEKPGVVKATTTGFAGGFLAGMQGVPSAPAPESLKAQGPPSTQAAVDARDVQPAVSAGTDPGVAAKGVGAAGLKVKAIDPSAPVAESGHKVQMKAEHMQSVEEIDSKAGQGEQRGSALESTGDRYDR
jgi:hypothetical protein